MASERSFKKAKEVASKKRCRLLPKNVQKILFLKHNFKAIGYKSANLCKNDDEESDEAEKISDEEDDQSESPKILKMNQILNRTLPAQSLLPLNLDNYQNAQIQAIKY